MTTVHSAARQQSVCVVINTHTHTHSRHLLI